MAAEKKTKTQMIKLQYFRSKICTPVKHKLVVKGLGFTRLKDVYKRQRTTTARAPCSRALACRSVSERKSRD